MSKRFLSNIIGLVVVAIFVTYLIVHGAIINAAHAKKVNETKAVMGEIGAAFSVHNKQGVMKWARGEPRDAWGNMVLLDSATKSAGQLRSKGPDGVVGTKDDILGEKFAIYPPKVESAIKIEERAEPGWMERVSKRMKGWKFWGSEKK